MHRALWIAYGESFPDMSLECLSEIRVIGTDQSNPPWRHLVPKGVKVITPQTLPRHLMTNVTATVEHCWGLILAAHRNVMAAAQYPYTDRNMWMAPWQLRHKNLGIIGFGRIGRGVAKIGEAFGMTILAYDLDDGSPGGSPESIRDAVITNSHVLVVATSPEATDVLGPSPAFRKDAILVSISPWHALGPNSRLMSWLREGALRAIATDQPGPPVVGQRKVHGLIMTPHIGGSTVESRHLVRQYVMEAMQQELAKDA